MPHKTYTLSLLNGCDFKVNAIYQSSFNCANAIYPIIEEAEPLETILEKYKNDFEEKSLQMMKSKLGPQMK